MARELFFPNLLLLVLPCCHPTEILAEVLSYIPILLFSRIIRRTSCWRQKEKITIDTCTNFRKCFEIFTNNLSSHCLVYQSLWRRVPQSDFSRWKDWSCHETIAQALPIFGRASYGCVFQISRKISFRRQIGFISINDPEILKRSEPGWHSSAESCCVWSFSATK